MSFGTFWNFAELPIADSLSATLQYPSPTPGFDPSHTACARDFRGLEATPRLLAQERPFRRRFRADTPRFSQGRVLAVRASLPARQAVVNFGAFSVLKNRKFSVT